jgi:carbonic anhydrase/acetyltransferase-like protein (isoleucine patch superfamily)
MENIVTYKNKKPQIADTAYINPYAIVIGDVVIGDGVSLWPGVIIRADDDRIIIGNNTAILDRAMVEAPLGKPVVIGEDVLISHGAVLHGCTVERGALIGISANILDGAVIGQESVIGAGALVPAGTSIPARSKAMGMPAQVTGEVTDTDISQIQTERKRVMEKAMDYGQWFVAKQI